jgi:FolB domain-containing protein
MDRLIVRDLRARCIIGARERERSAPQEVRISVFLALDLGRAGRSDSLEHTIDYSSLVKKIVTCVEGSRFFLLEALAQAIADTCLAEGAARRVKVRVSKPAAAGRARIIEVELIRERTR